MPEWLKQDIVGLTGLSRDALHIHIGLALMLAAMALLDGRRVVLAWGFVLLIELVNETVELSGGFPHIQNGDWANSVHDIVNTMIWPTVLLVLCSRGWVRLAAPRPRPWRARSRRQTGAAARSEAR